MGLGVHPDQTWRLLVDLCARMSVLPTFPSTCSLQTSLDKLPTPHNHLDMPSIPIRRHGPLHLFRRHSSPQTRRTRLTAIVQTGRRSRPRSRHTSLAFQVQITSRRKDQTAQRSAFAEGVAQKFERLFRAQAQARVHLMLSVAWCLFVLNALALVCRM